MKINRPWSIQLTSEERELCDLVDFDLEGEGPEHYKRSGEAARQLTVSLVGRQAIPQCRIQYFDDPELNVGGHGNSHRQWLARNTTPRDLFTDPSFTTYLRYFIHGPQLPPETFEAFVRVVEDDLGTSGMVRDQLRQCVRREVRRLARRDGPDLADEFLRLALEVGLDTKAALSIRRAAVQGRR